MAIGDIINSLNSAQDALNSSNNPLTESQANQFKADGFLVPATFSADGNGLPSSKVQRFKDSQFKRNIITWFVPEFGVVRMYVNPTGITYNHKKLINKDRTKGGYTLQYWGEELDTLSISGTTGSAGIEGINVLYEIYRAEQFATDATGLTLAANNVSNPNLLSSVFGGAGSDNPSINGLGNTIGSILGMDTPNTGLVANSINSLAQLAFGVEMYYNGWVFRGYFDSMSVTESANNFCLEYSITFNVTQRRGYRVNYFPWSKSAIDGPSQFNTPPSFSGIVKPGL